MSPGYVQEWNATKINTYTTFYAQIIFLKKEESHFISVHKDL